MKGDRVILSFECADGGLKTSDGKKMTGFAIAGIDGKYHWAEACLLYTSLLFQTPPSMPKMYSNGYVPTDADGNLNPWVASTQCGYN